MTIHIMTDDTFNATITTRQKDIFILTEDSTLISSPAQTYFTDIQKLKENLESHYPNEKVDIFFSDNPIMKIIQSNLMEHTADPIDYLVDGEYLVKTDVKSLLMSFEIFTITEEYDNFDFTFVEY